MGELMALKSDVPGFSGDPPPDPKQPKKPRKPRKPKAEKPERRYGRDHANYPYDPIFFRKVDIKLGAELINFGRMDPGSTWRVDAIWTDLGLGRGRRRREVAFYMKDHIVLIRISGPTGDHVTQRECSFQNLSYSAIWRLRER